MKRLFTLLLSCVLFLLAFADCHSQVKSSLNATTSNLYQEIQKEKSSFISEKWQVFPASKLKNQAYHKNQLSYAEYIEFPVRTFLKDQQFQNYIEVAIPYKGEIFNCTLKRHHLKSEAYTLIGKDMNAGKQKINASYYQGIVEGQGHSWVTLSIIDNKFRFLIAHHEGNLEVAHFEEGVYSIYESTSQLKIPDFICQHKDSEFESVQQPSSKSTARSVGSDCLELYIECDHESYLDNGSSVSATEAWALGIVNDVATMYDLIDVPIVISQTFVHTTADPYVPMQSLTAIRNAFVAEIGDNYDGRVAQLFSTREIGGGLAYGLGGLCGTSSDFPGPYSIATSLSTSYDPFPNYSYTVNVVGHELGHVFGARHTHACVWGVNGDTQIDDCGNVWANNNEGTPEGLECFDDTAPILPMTGGTLMSYCNLTGTGINLANGFSTEVGDFIFEEYSTAVCATGGLCAALPPPNDLCADAKVVPVRGQCSYLTYDNFMATASGVADPSCGNAGAGEDVWFTFEATGPDINVFFNSVSNGVEDAIIAVYTGSCGSLTEVKCEVAMDEEILIKVGELTLGEDVFVRVIEDGSDVVGEFELCFEDPNLPCHQAYNALVDLYNSTNGSSWSQKTGWELGAVGADCDVCSWYGITCDNLGNVIDIDLMGNNLVGTIPSTLEELHFLRGIKIWQNTISGVFPDIWMDMPDMEYIDLSNNQLTGTLPATIGDLDKLTTIYVENNLLDGPLPEFIGDLPSIDVVWLKGNDFSGCYPGTYLNLCDIASTNFKDNDQLPDTGLFIDFCIDGTDGDIDKDGFCFGVGPGKDCVDDDDTIYPGAPELCDGKDNNCNGEYDEGLTSSTTFTLSGSGNWDNAGNWDNGIPTPCQDVIIPASGSARTVTIQVGVQAFARSVTISNNSSLVNEENIVISGSDINGLDVNTGAVFINNNICTITNILVHGLITDGQVQNNAMLNVSNLSSNQEVYIEINGTIDCSTNGQIIVH